MHFISIKERNPNPHVTELVASIHPPVPDINPNVFADYITVGSFIDPSRSNAIHALSNVACLGSSDESTVVRAETAPQSADRGHEQMSDRIVAYLAYLGLDAVEKKGPVREIR